MKDDLRDATITLCLDGWSSVRNDPIIASSIHTGSKAYLLNAKDSEANKKTAEYCCDIAVSAIEECKLKYGKEVCKLKFFCTLNESYDIPIIPYN